MCFIQIKEEEIVVNGIWGPFYGALVPNMWNYEAGQSAAGKLVISAQRL